MGQKGRKNFFETIAEAVTANANNLKGLGKKNKHKKILGEERKTIRMYGKQQVIKVISLCHNARMQYSHAGQLT